MKQAKQDIPVRIDSPNAVARQQTDFGDATDYGTFGAEYFTLTEGTDITPLFEGLKDDRCQSPHWGYVVDGALTVTYTDGTDEVDETGDLFDWPPGHTLRADKDTDFVLFSPQHEHGDVLDRVRHNMVKST